MLFHMFVQSSRRRFEMTTLDGAGEVRRVSEVGIWGGTVPASPRVPGLAFTPADQGRGSERHLFPCRMRSIGEPSRVGSGLRGGGGR